MPASGYPCVIVGHGLPGQRGDELMQLANALTASGWIVAGIDMLTNGARANDPKYRQDTVTFWQNAPGAKYSGAGRLRRSTSTRAATRRRRARGDRETSTCSGAA